MNFGMKTFQRIAERSRVLRAYSSLEKMDDRMLKDIGVTRDQVRAQKMRTKFI